MPRFLTVLFSLLWVMTILKAGASSDAPSSVAGHIDLENLAGGGFHLKVDQATTGDVLDRLSSQVGIPIVHGHEREEPITLACSSVSIKDLLKCVLGSNANLLYIAGDSSIKHPSGFERIVVLSSPQSHDARMPPVIAPDGVASTEKALLPASARPSRDLIMAMLQHQDGAIRAEAIALLPRVEGIDRDRLRTAYESALQDPAGDVRAGALLGLSTLDASSTVPLVASAAMDPDPSVRLAAIDAMAASPQNRGFFIEALKDRDESVRVLAGLRLESSN
ncbi:MAG: hypothetical protein D4R76_07980 [Methylococcus sp.]|nr:MAG: hypothetical protein D4R76_07980 [Methylococcus sp.]